MAKAERAMVMARRVVGNTEGDGDSNSEVVGDGAGDKGGRCGTAMRVIAMVTVKKSSIDGN